MTSGEIGREPRECGVFQSDLRTKSAHQDVMIYCVEGGTKVEQYQQRYMVLVHCQQERTKQSVHPGQRFWMRVSTIQSPGIENLGEKGLLMKPFRWRYAYYFLCKIDFYKWASCGRLQRKIFNEFRTFCAACGMGCYTWQVRLRFTHKDKILYWFVVVLFNMWTTTVFRGVNFSKVNVLKALL